MVADLVLLGLGIALQPFRVSAFILILSTKDGTKKGLGFVLGWLASLLLVIAVVVLITGGRPVRYHTFPATVVQIAKLALGVVLIVMAAVQAHTPRRPRVLTILQARLSGAADWFALVSFCLLATSSFAALELYAVRAPAAASIRLAALRSWLDTHGNQVIVILCAVLGLWLTGQSIYMLITA